MAPIRLGYGECEQRANCGKRGGYVMGCRGELCYKAQREYGDKYRSENYDRKLVSARPSRKHLVFLVRHGLSYRKIAEKCFVHHTTISEILYGKRKKTGRDIEKLILGVSLYNVELADRRAVIHPNGTILKDGVKSGYIDRKSSSRVKVGAG